MSTEDFKRAAAEAALAYVEPGMKLGLGTGSTAAHFIELLGAKVAEGLDVSGVPTSEASRELAERHGVPLTTLKDTPELDLTVDGADEIDGRLNLIKGGGAALLREKIVAFASKRMIVIADASKRVERLGAFPLPIEVVPFGKESTRRAIERLARDLGLGSDVAIRRAEDECPVVTDSGHVILDARLGLIDDPERLSVELNRIPGVVEHGLFLRLASLAIVADQNGVKTIEPASAQAEQQPMRKTA
ncbi:ribose-5-phosphate isomerase RpiA [Hansschlegelia zhihuaiae]|uniref:Ribose-5-phosphate isomerase A n=1 Tax=Hansschlegelia zhihuaiae TaxID=405005 RepID=A0A4Q0MGI4_9HYPH|nr:ribose-5-phosphate isomerase RpiA [Hansschlegelia zhihuaiae]RXF72056.1 ribose-5-phosphate isomerase RpiA [Hansschlegelia zhihuaiae]